MDHFVDKLRIMLVAGEPSGDSHAARLVAAMREIASGRELEFFGSAGPAMRTAGVDAVVRADNLSIMGLPEIASALPMFIRAYRTLRSAAVERRPDVVVLVDFPEFNLKLARSLKRAGFPIVYYISPQLWGWRKYRRRTIRDNVDLLLTILPFEKEWYEAHGITNVEYVGSPLVNEVRPTISRSEFRARLGIGDEEQLTALLPGSRQKEVSRILPTMLEAVALMRKRRSDARCVVALAPGRKIDEVHSAAARIGWSNLSDHGMSIVHGQTYDAVNASDAAAVASGTATLETGMLSTPMAVVYRASTFNYRLIRPLIDVEHFGLINLIAGERIAPELIQDELTPEALSSELLRLLEPAENGKVRERLKTAVARLGEGGASMRAAEAVLRVADRAGQ
ncbi:MAG TPA: lipid-A-disaccharide synthase [Pyrinomonadaceae bacterium]|nr:lipid-A-disaccharide synthase [Pyrinomonadaceae bacterium]